MRQILIVLALCLTITSCSLFRVQKMDIEQGNSMPTDVVNQLHTGMSLQEVKEVLGSPTLNNAFDDNRINYVYTFQPGYGKKQEKHLTLIFSHKILKEIHQDSN